MYLKARLSEVKKDDETEERKKSRKRKYVTEREHRLQGEKKDEIWRKKQA